MESNFVEKNQKIANFFSGGPRFAGLREAMVVQRKLASPGHRDRAYSVRASARRTIRTNNRNCLFFHHRFIGGGYRFYVIYVVFF